MKTTEATTEPKPQINPLNSQELIRQLVQGIYDIQGLRISMGNRLCGQFRHKLGLEEDQKEQEDEDAAEILDAIRIDYKLVTDGWVKNHRALESKFKGHGVISTVAEYELIKVYMDMQRSEESMFKSLGKRLEEFPIYKNWLSNIRGCGPAMSGAIIACLRPEKAKYPSSFWKYAGYDTTPTIVGIDADGKEKVLSKEELNTWSGSREERLLGRSKKAQHLVRVKYTTSEGQEAERDSVTFNPWLKTKLYVLGTCFIRAGGKYSDIYKGYKFRLENSPKWATKTKAHRHNASLRYMIKIFLQDLWKEWRTLEGLPTPEPYYIAKLGMAPHGSESQEHQSKTAQVS